jgi:CheY-like chemotaxis protein
LNAVVTAMEPMLRRLLGEDVDLTAVLGDGLGRVKADPGQIEQVLMNLAANARDAMPRAGRLTLETANADLYGDYPRLHADVEPGSYVMLAVSDSGHGMSREILDHLFEPFFTTKEPGKGTGLGLATVHGIVKQSGGHVFVYSEPGRGTTFKIYLPRVESRTEKARAPAEQIRPRGSETILLVEDEESLRKLVRHRLEASGYTVIEARHAAHALEIIETGGATIHLLLTDLVMPGLSGRELAERVARLLPTVKALYMSGYTDDAVVRHGVLTENMAFLQKPFTSEALLRRVREVLDSGLQ